MIVMSVDMSLEEAVTTLKSMFSAADRDVIETLLEANGEQF